MISNQDIVVLSTIDWDFLWQGHQEIAQRLHDAGNRVLFVENTGVRAPRLADAPRVASRIRNWVRGWKDAGLRRDPNGVYVYSPVVLPALGSTARRRINRSTFLRLIERAARSLDMTDPVIWTYLPTDTAVDLIDRLRGSNAVVYYCVDNFEELSPNPARLQRFERQVIERSDVVFATFSELAKNCARWNSNVHTFPFGVNLDAFELDPDAARPPSSPPTIGYVGGLHQHVDVHLLAHAARERPEWHWVLVGAEQAPLGELPELPNVQLLGQRPHAELVSHIRDFDVCIVPYVYSAYTSTVVPTKINEYLAVGKSVVSTAIPAVRDFNDTHNVLRTCEPTVSDFLAKIEEALKEQPVEQATVRHRRDVAELADWGTRLEQMAELIEEAQVALGHKRGPGT